MEKRIVRSIVSGSVQAPSSKSYAQRAIAAALLARGRSTLRNLELCSDTRAALLTAGALGAATETTSDRTCIITGGLNPVARTLDIGESGLSARMFTPIAALCGVPVTITGHGSILTRRMDMMLDPLRELGVGVESNGGYLPVTVRGPIAGGEARVDGSVSSQFITGLLMALPLAREDTTIRVDALRSIPYIDMTLDVLGQFGIEVKHNDYTEFFIGGMQQYTPRDYNVEGDWSGASCLLVAGALAGGITVRNLNHISRQADVAIVDALSRAGAGITTTADSITVERPGELRPFVFDATHCPDLFPALAALASGCEGVSTIRGTHRLAHKESDRALTLQEEFGKLGIETDLSEDDVMRITGGPVRGAATTSHNDHRIAMAVAAAALRADGPVVIDGSEAVGKSYPAFWDDLRAVTRPVAE